jgi:hypothetical protein
MKLKLPVLILTLFLVLTLIPAAFAQVEDDEVSDFCLDATTYLQPEEGFPHPVGSRIALRYEVEYPVVMSWFCQGYGFGQIMLALETSKVMDTTDTDENGEFDLQKYAESLLLTRKFEQGRMGSNMEGTGLHRASQEC